MRARRLCHHALKIQLEEELITVKIAKGVNKIRTCTNINLIEYKIRRLTKPNVTKLLIIQSKENILKSSELTDNTLLIVTISSEKLISILQTSLPID